jgi:hypothetical protein
MLRFTPDIRIFQFKHDFFQLFTFLVVVKDTPVANRRVISGRPGAEK